MLDRLACLSIAVLCLVLFGPAGPAASAQPSGWAQPTRSTHTTRSAKPTDSARPAGWARPTGSAQPVPEVDLAAVSLSTFADDELDLPYYLAHFHRIANSVRMSEPHRGFIDLKVWRRPERNVPHNARVMENVVSLAYFYTARRPWNPYYGHSALRERLEAALAYLVRLQLEDGSFTWDDPSEGKMSTTAFATKFLGQTIRMLSAGPPVDPTLFDSIIEADRRAVITVLTRDDFYRSGRRYANQYTNVFAGALAYLDLFPDAEVRRLLESRMQEIGSNLQSPAGYYYEHGGPDWTYDIETHHSNHRVIWHYLRGSPEGYAYADQVRLWYDWLADNALIEPDGSGFSMNHALETRLSFPFYRENRASVYTGTCSPMAEVVVTARAFCESEEERVVRLRRDREDLQRSWPEVPPLEIGTFAAYSPYAFLHRDLHAWFPSDSSKVAARRRLPYARPVPYARVRWDDRHGSRVLFVRRPAYYAAFSSGERLTRQQRFGLGILWHPQLGTVLQSQSGSGASWGTRTDASGIVSEAEILQYGDVVVSIDGNELANYQQAAGAEIPGTSETADTHAVDEGDVRVGYQIGARGRKSVEFLRDEIVVTARHSGHMVERLPFVVGPAQEVRAAASSAWITSPAGRVEVLFPEDAEVSLMETDRLVGKKHLVVLELKSTDSLTYRIRFVEGGRP